MSPLSKRKLIVVFLYNLFIIYLLWLFCSYSLLFILKNIFSISKPYEAILQS